MTRTAVAALIALAAVLAVVPAGAAEGDVTYGPAEYAEGPERADEWSHASRDADGRMIVGRAYPLPGEIGCPGIVGGFFPGEGGAYSNYQVTHVVEAPFEAITVAFTEAAFDGYTWAGLVARREARENEDGTVVDEEPLGSHELRGPAVGDGTLTIDVDPALFEAAEEGEEPLVAPGDQITILFGLKTASACPHVNGGTARFTEVVVGDAPAADPGEPGSPGELPELPGLPDALAADPVVASLPGSATPAGPAVGYVPKAVVVPAGSSLIYHNLDVALHDVKHDVPEPLFRSAAIGLNQQAEVVGVADLPPGSYPFICTFHSNMTGTLQVT